MSLIRMLMGRSRNNTVTLTQVIDELSDASVLFVGAWSAGDRAQSQRASDNGVGALDTIVTHLLLRRDSQRSAGVYNGSQFQVEMRASLGHSVSNASHADHQAVAAAVAGQGQLPIGRVSQSLTFEELLQKIKHRSNNYTNFRVVGTSHIFVICPENTDATPDSVVEFNMGDFCTRCQAIDYYIQPQIWRKIRHSALR